MAFAGLGRNAIGNVLEFMDRRSMFEFALVSHNTRKIFDGFAMDYSGLSSLAGREVNYDVLNQGCFTTDDIAMYSKYIRENKELMEILRRIIKTSRYLTKFGFIAGNAATILNYSNFDFSYEDFTEVQIPGADLTSAKLIFTNFTGANLKNVNFEKAYSKGAIFKKALVRNSSLPPVSKRSLIPKSICLIPKSISLSCTDIKIKAKSPTKRNRELAYASSRTATCIVVSADAALVAYSISDRFYLWLEDFRYHSSPHQGEVSALAFFKSNLFIASGDSFQVIKIWKISTCCALFHTLIGHTSGILSLCVSPDDQLIASGSADCSVKVWDKNRRKIMCRGHEDSVTGVVWSNNGKLIVSVSNDKTLRIWNLDGVGVVVVRDMARITAVTVNEMNEIFTGNSCGCVRQLDFNGKVIGFYNSKVGEIKNIWIDGRTKKYLVHGIKGVSVRDCSDRSVRDSYGDITSVCVDASGDYMFIGYNSGFIGKLSVALEQFVETGWAESEIIGIEVVRHEVVLAAEINSVNVYDIRLKFTKYIKFPWKILEFGLTNTLMLLVTENEHDRNLIMIDSVTEEVLLSLPTPSDTLNFYLVKKILIVINKNYITFHNLELSTRAELSIYDIHKTYLQYPYLIINKEKRNLITYNLKTMETGTVLELAEEVNDVKYTTFLKNFVISLKTSLALYSEEFIMLSVISLEDSGKIYVFTGMVLLWAENVILKIKFSDIESEDCFSNKRVLYISS